MKNTHSIDLDEVKSKLYEYLKPSGWGNKLKTFILSNDFEIVLVKLLEEAREGKRFTPPVKQIFRAFEECPYDKLKIVIMGQDVYPYAGAADGIAFSCSNTGKVEASLKYMFKDIEDNVYPQDGYTWDPDLKRWSNQGILMLSSSLTTTIGKVGTHYGLWRPFMEFLFDVLIFQNSGLIYTFMGKKAQEWSKYVSKGNWILQCSHPASAAHANLPSWDSGNIFTQMSDLVESQYKEKIIW